MRAQPRLWFRRRLHASFLGALLLIASGTPVLAQPSTFWVHAGLGISDEEDSAGSAGLNYQYGTSLVTLRGALSLRLFEQDIWDVGLLYGLATRPAVIHAAVGVGVAVVGGSECEGCGLLGGGEEELETFGPVIGLPLQAQLSLRPLPFLGIALYGFGNLNRHRSFGGVTASLQLGRLR